jgi:type I site-specific restriction endonuclease
MVLSLKMHQNQSLCAECRIYRLIKYAKVHRALFLVDRRNLGKQALQLTFKGTK